MFSGFETVLISAFMSFISCAGTIYAMTRKFVAKGDCAYHHSGVQREDADINKKLERINQKQDMQFRMLRVLILQLELPNDKKVEILNMRPE